MDDLALNVADFRERSRVNGPGVRAVVWVQGCTRGCAGCFNPATHPHAPRRMVSPEQLADRVADLGVDGLTISGGEPFEQAEACARLAERVWARGLSVVVFTGFSLAELRRSEPPPVTRFLGAIDLLVAGPYVATLRTDGKRLLGSANQRVHHLTDRLRTAGEADPPTVELSSDGRGLSWSGFPSEEDVRWLERLAR